MPGGFGGDEARAKAVRLTKQRQRKVVRKKPPEPVGRAVRPDAQVSDAAVKRVVRSPQYKKILKEAEQAGAEHKLDRAAERKGLLKRGGSYYLKHPRRFLPDIYTPIKPEAILAPDKKRFSVKDIDTKAAGHNVVKEKVPVTDLLEETTRPLHAVAGASLAAVEGKNVLKAAKRGIQNKDKTTFSDVLKAAGVPKAVRAPAGFALDIAADPTTYVTFGAGSVAARAGARAARDTAERALKAGMTEAGAATVAKRAGRNAAEAASKQKGVTVSFAGKELPGVRKATATATGGVKRVVRSAAEKPGVRKVAPKVQAAGRAVRGAASDVRPSLRPSGVDEAQFHGIRSAASQARAHVNRVSGEQQAQARAYQKALGPDNYELVIDAIERGNIGKLDPDLQAAAIRIRSDFRHAKRLRKRAGLAEGTIGGERKSQVPEITADPEKTRAALRSAIAERNRIERAHRSQIRKAGVAEGRAQVLVGQSDRRVLRKKGKPASTKPARTLGKLERERGKLMQLEEGGVVARARQAVRDAEKAHETEKALARNQRLAQRRSLKQAARREGEAKGYFPHAREDVLHAGLGISDEAVEGVKPLASGGRTLPKPGSSKAREGKRPISEQNRERLAKGEEAFSTNVPLVTLNYHTETAKVASRSEFLKKLADLGREAKPGAKVQPGEQLYHLGYQNRTFGLHPVKDSDVGKHAGRYVLLNKRAVDDATKSIGPMQSTSTLGRGFDKVTGGFKRLATATPGFHVRNFVGDTQMAYLEQPGHQLPRNVGQAGKALKRLSQREAEKRRVTVKPSRLAGDTRKETIKVAGKRQNLDEFLDGALQHGVVRSGFIGRELEDLAGRGTKLGKVRRTGTPVRRWMQNREDLMRIATYKHGLDRGLSPQDAARRSKEIHIDYGDLTQFERKYARRAAPFYTFNARALPLHAKKLVTNPGKFANYEKLREEASKELGLDVDQFDDWLQEFQQRLAPIPTKIGGAVNAVSAGLPLTLLNELPTGVSPKRLAQYLNEIGQYAASLANPIIKDPVELYANKNFAFRSEIESAHGPLVAAPVWVKWLPDPVKKAAGVTPDYVDKRTGKKTWGWRGNADYIAKAMGPGPINLGNALLAKGTSRRGQGTTAKWVSGLTGVKADVVDKQSAEIGRLYKQSLALDKRINAFHQRGIFKGNATPELLKITEQKKQIDSQINRLSVERGDKIPLKRKPGRKGGSLFDQGGQRKSLFDSGKSSGSLFD